MPPPPAAALLPLSTAGALAGGHHALALGVAASDEPAPAPAAGQPAAPLAPARRAAAGTAAGPRAGAPPARRRRQRASPRARAARARAGECGAAQAAALQDKVIAGMCNLQVFERENLRRTSKLLGMQLGQRLHEAQRRQPQPAAVLALGQDRGDLDRLARLLGPLEPPLGRPRLAPRQHQPLPANTYVFLW